MRPRRRCYGLEHLEPRHLPSMTLPGIASTGPADGAVVVQAPQTFTITFDQQVADQDEADFGAMIGIPADQVLPTVVAVDSGQDFEIQQVGPEGSTSSVLGGHERRSLQEAVATSTAPNGSSVTQLVITPQGGSPAYVPGTYQIDVMPQTFLDDVFADGSADSAWYTASDPIPIAQFTVLGPGRDARRRDGPGERSAQGPRASQASSSRGTPNRPSRSTNSRCRRGIAGNSTPSSIPRPSTARYCLHSASSTRRGTCWRPPGRPPIPSIPACSRAWDPGPITLACRARRTWRAPPAAMTRSQGRPGPPA